MLRQRLPYALMLLGALLGFTLSALATWAEVEASQYGFLPFTRNRMSSLRCPVFLNPTETGTVSMKVTNQADYTGTFIVRITKSSPGPFQEITERIRLEPDATRTLSWTIGPENIDMGHFIFVDVIQFGAYPNPRRQGQCGIYILPWPQLPGKVAEWGGLALSLALLWGGWWWSRRLQTTHPIPLGLQRMLGFLSVLIPLTLLVSYWGHWLFAMGLLIIDLTALVALGLYALVVR